VGSRAVSGQMVVGELAGGPAPLLCSFAAPFSDAPWACRVGMGAALFSGEI